MRDRKLVFATVSRSSLRPVSFPVTRAIRQAPVQPRCAPPCFQRAAALFFQLVAWYIKLLWPLGRWRAWLRLRVRVVAAPRWAEEAVARGSIRNGALRAALPSLDYSREFWQGGEALLLTVRIAVRWMVRKADMPTHKLTAEIIAAAIDG
jgi:hypothetical protein